MEGLTSIHPAIRPAFAIDTTERLRVHNRWELNEPCASAYAAYKAQRFDLPGFIARFFTDGDLPGRYFGDNYNFVRVMRNMLASLQSLDFQAPDGWQPFFGEEDFAAVHDIQSSFTMLLLGRSSLSGNIGLEWYRDVWQSVLDNTLTDLEQGQVAAGLYFTHDILIDNLLAVLRLDRFGDDIQPMEAITTQYPISAVPMASNLQLCICRDQASDETIVYPLLNGRCGRLQGLQEVRPGAYRWEEVAARLRQ